MTDERSTPDPDALERLAAYSPTRATLSAAWDADDRADLRARLLADAAAAHPPRFRSRRPRRAGQRQVLAPLLAAAAVVALIVGVVAAAIGHDDGTGGRGLRPAGPGYSASRVTPTDQVGPGQYAYTVDTAYAVDADGTTQAAGRNEEWIAPNGDTWSYRTFGGTAADCYHFPFERPASFGGPDQAFVDALPTDPDELLTYLRSHVSGSSSTEEAVFTAVGDLLTSADGLATSELRAALVTVLSRTDGVTVHRDVLDPRKRPAVRADFVDEAKRPGEVSSLYFDRDTYQLLATRSGTTGRPGDTDGPSVAYSLPPSGGATPTELTGRADLDVVSVEKVVDRLPAKLRGCADDSR